MSVWNFVKIGEKFLGSCKCTGELANGVGYQGVAKAGALFGTLRDPFWTAYAVRDLFFRLPSQTREDAVDHVDSLALGTLRSLSLAAIICRLGTRMASHPFLNYTVDRINSVIPYFATFLSLRSATERLEGPLNAEDCSQLASDVTDVMAHCSVLVELPIVAAVAGLTSCNTSICANALAIKSSN